MEQLLKIVNHILAKKGGRDPLTALEASISLRRDLGFDSLALAELTVRVEDAFGVDIFAKQTPETIGDILSQLGPS